MLRLRCLVVCHVSCYIMFVCCQSLCYSLHYCINSHMSVGLLDLNLNLFFFFCLPFLSLHSTTVSDQAQVVCVYQASVSGGGTGSHTSSSSPSGVSSPRYRPVSHCTGPACRQVGFFAQINDLQRNG